MHAPLNFHPHIRTKIAIATLNSLYELVPLVRHFSLASALARCFIIISEDMSAMPVLMPDSETRNILIAADAAYAARVL